MSTYAVKHPIRLEWSRMPDGDLMLSAVAGADRLQIVASRERWSEAIEHAMRGRIVDPAEIARGMFVRGEIEVEQFERVLEVGQ